MKYLVTGGMGFIGSNLMRRMLDLDPRTEIVCLDAYTYAARPDWVWAHPESETKRFNAVKGDLSDALALQMFIENVQFDAVIHLAAESHVCRSIEGPDKFVRANINGTFNLLEACRKKWGDYQGIFHHVSTDEVYGSLEDWENPFDEDYQIQPRSPYAASKAASDLLVKAYAHTYGMNVRVTNCSNNFGPNQHEEKLVPRTILAFLKGEEMTVYGKGTQVRDWVWVDDHVDAILTVMDKGVRGESYCVGGAVEATNLQMIEWVKLAVEFETNRQVPLNIRFTNDRPTDDQRYAICNDKISRLGWSPKVSLFEGRLRQTVRWYMERLK